jgi:hypothetical protein
MLRFSPQPPRAGLLRALAFLVMPGAAGAIAAHLLAEPLASLGTGAAVLLAALLLVIAPVVVQISTGPLLRLTGRSRRLSPLLLVEAENEALRLHGGTLFDYLEVFSWEHRGAAARSATLRSFVDGLLVLAREAEAGLWEPSMRIVASSTILSGHTPSRYGFRTRPASLAERLPLLLDWPNQALRSSFAAGRPALPRLRGALTATTTAAELAEHRTVLERTQRRLGARREHASGIQ